MKKTTLFEIIIKSLIITAFSLIMFSLPLPAAENLKLEKISTRVYAVLPAEGGKAFANSSFILLDDGVFVIDSQSSEELSLELISIIKKTTDKPIKYLLNTHFHNDHTEGNGSFAPDARIILHGSTLAKLEAKGSNLSYPLITTNCGMTLNYKDFPIQILWMGKAHTDGDLLVYLPAEKILIAGDIFFNQTIPYTKDGHIGDWLVAIQRTLELDFNKIVPGHGPIADRTEFMRFRELLAWAKAVADSERAKGTEKERIPEAARQTELYKSRIVHYTHQERLADLLESAYQEIIRLKTRFNMQK